MSKRGPLSEADIHDALKGLPGWILKDDQIEKTYSFDTFRDAVAFIVRLSFEAESIDHHPAIKNVYSRVSIALTTHDAGNRVTQMDLDLAEAIEAIA